MSSREGLMSEERRQFIKGTAALAATGAAAGGAWAAGSDAPEKKEVRIGFIPLTDCASVVMASVLKFDEKYGIKIIATKEASWAGVRDKLVNGELDMAHVLYGLVYGVHLGVGGPKKRHGRVDEFEPQRPSHHAEQKTRRQRRGGRRQPGQGDGR